MSFPQLELSCLTTFDGDEDIYRALQAGARGYLLKGMDADELIDAIRTVHAGKTRIPAPVAQRLAGRMGGQELTARETEVLKQIVAGKSNREIGEVLFISEATVKTHINSPARQAGSHRPYPGRDDRAAARNCPLLIDPLSLTRCRVRLMRTLGFFMLIALALTSLRAQERTSWHTASEPELKALIPARAPVVKERIETEFRTASGITDSEHRFIAGVVLHHCWIFRRGQVLPLSHRAGAHQGWGDAAGSQPVRLRLDPQ